MDPTLKTISMLKGIVPDLSPRLRTVAKYIVDHPSDFGLDSIRETAHKCRVSTYTLVRMAERSGFASYHELREPFRNALVSSTELIKFSEWLESLRENGELGQAQVDASVNTLAIVHRSLESQSHEQLTRVSEMLHRAENVYLTAFRASYALAYYFHFAGRMALPSLQLIPHHMNNAIDELNNANDQDVMIAITVTPYSRETIEACKFALQKGLRLIMISDSELISTEFTPDESLVASVLSTHRFGYFSGIMAIIETLLAMLVKMGGEQAVERINSYEDLRNKNNAYWIAQKNISFKATAYLILVNLHTLRFEKSGFRPF